MGNTLYETDFHAWLLQQAHLLRAGDVCALDLENLAGEIESLGGSQRRELGSRLQILLMHLLKWQMQPEHQSRSWQSTIRTQRDEIDALLEQNPSLRPTTAGVIERVYARARERALEETGLLADPFPARCPYAADQVLDAGFLP